MTKKVMKRKPTKRKVVKKRPRTSNIVRLNPRSKLPFPTRLLTALEVTLDLYCNAASAVQQNYGAIYLNSLYQPFNPATYNLISAAFASASPVLSTGNVMAVQPVGWNILSSIYQYYKVHKTEYSVTCQPQSTQDPIDVCVFPFLYGGTNPFTTLTQQQSCDLPFAKAALVVSGTNYSSVTLKGKVLARSFLGYSKIQYGGLAPISTVSAPSTNSSIALGVRWVTNNNSALNMPINWQFKLKLYCELFANDFMIV